MNKWKYINLKNKANTCNSTHEQTCLRIFTSYLVRYLLTIQIVNEKELSVCNNKRTHDAFPQILLTYNNSNLLCCFNVLTTFAHVNSLTIWRKLQTSHFNKIFYTIHPYDSNAKLAQRWPLKHFDECKN